MADGYGDILGGFDPYAGQRLAAAMSATLGADPGRLAYSFGPVGRALGQISGGFERARAIVSYAESFSPESNFGV
jgi:hypothetical protein